MSYDYSENVLVQDSAAALLHDELGWDVVYAYNQEVLGENGTLGRKNYHEIMLWRYFRQTLRELNPWISYSQIEEACKTLSSHLSSASLLQINEEKYFLIRDGIPVTVKKPDGKTESRRAIVIDFSNVNRNHFLAVKEMKIHGDLYRRRTDIVGFVNGLPLLFIELKRNDVDVENVEGDFIWKLRPELYEALTDFNIMTYEWKNEEEKAPLLKEGETRYWWLTANPKIWSFADLAIGEAQAYTLYNENGNKRRIFQNFLDARVGDIVIGYESNPVKKIVALGKIKEEQDGEKILFEKTESLTNPVDYAVLKDCTELANMEFFQNAQGSLLKIEKDEYDFIMDLIREENPLKTEENTDTYTKDDFLEDVYMTEAKYDHLVSVLQNKKNIILQGAPGVGKTFAAKRLAYSIMGEKDEDRIEFVQFHQNYSYEDFVMGYKPAGDGFELKNGIFFRFCQKAANQPNKEFFFIIDEINRGNMVWEHICQSCRAISC